MVALSASHFACAAETTDDSGTGGTGTGGAINGAGGTIAGAGGSTVGSGGSTVGSGGSIVGSGGSTGAGGGGTTLPNPTLTPSTFATDGYGDSDPWAGYTFTYAFGSAAINPPCGTGACFTGANVCAAGTIPASTEAGVGIGFNVNQLPEETVEGTWTMTGTGVIVDTERAPAGARVQVKSGGVDYCAPATDGVAIAWSSFKTECWGTTGTALPAGSAITAIEVTVPGTEAAQTFDFCVINISLAP